MGDGRAWLQPRAIPRPARTPVGRAAMPFVAAVAVIHSVAACDDLTMEAGVVPASLSIQPADTTVTIGQIANYSVLVVDQGGRPIYPAPSWARPVWSSFSPEIVHMERNGQAEAVRFGEAQLAVTFAGLRARTGVRANPATVTLSVDSYHFTQAVQNSMSSVPLIAGRDALLRVFVTGDQESYFQPVVEASFYRNNTLARRFMMEPEFEILPAQVDEGRLDLSFNALIPGSLIEPGTEMFIEVDRERDVPAGPQSNRRVPEVGTLPLDVRVLPPMELTVVPIVTEATNGTDVYEWTDGMTPDSEQLRHARSVLPIGELTVNVHAGFMTSADLTTASGWSRLLGELTFLRVAEGERGYYYGAVSLVSESTPRGLGFIGHPVAVGRAHGETLAHEVGHNLGLHHAPCGGAIAPDQAFPYPNGSIGVWGYDVYEARLVSASLYRDFMGYCSPSWVSDYHFTRAMEFRLHEEESLVAGADHGSIANRGTLLLWGRVGRGELALDPAFIVDLPAILPETEGPYRIEGFGSEGQRRFDLRFAPRPDAWGGGSFLFAVPYDPSLRGALDEVVLSGPEGTVTLKPFGSRPMAIVRERGSGRVRGILRNWTGEAMAGLPIDYAELEIVVSEGIPR